MECNFSWSAEFGAWHYCSERPYHDGPHYCGYGDGTCGAEYVEGVDKPSQLNN